MNIKTKILIPSLVAVAMMLVLGIFSYSGMRTMQQALDDVSTKGMQHTALLNGSRGELLAANVGAYRLFSTMANFDEARIQKETLVIVAHADNAIRFLKKMRDRSDVIEDKKKALESFDELLSKYRKIITQAIDMADADLSTATGMMQAAEPSAEERAAIESRVERGGPIEEALAAATATLSGLSACAGLVLVPKREPVLRQVGFVSLSETQALAVLVGADGSVENRVVDLPPGMGHVALVEAANYMNARLSGLTLSDARMRIAREIGQGRAALDSASQELVSRGLAVWSEDPARRPVLIVRGQANLIDAAASADLERVRQLLDELESAEEIARLLDSAREGTATRIFIGSENKLFSLSGSSVIAAPYRGQDGRVVGVVGV
ncbi:MAG: MCP four helix bundle domain-containing protein, partial [Afipia sp.]|nr:MCP four helix bundle domain-containing protein [Afipia sp.]